MTSINTTWHLWEEFLHFSGPEYEVICQDTWQTVKLMGWMLLIGTIGSSKTRQCKGISNTSAKWSSCWRFVQRVFFSFIFPKNPSVCQRSAFVVKTMMFHVDFFSLINLNLLFFFSPKIGNFFFLPNSRFNFFFSSRRWWWMFRKLFLHLNGCCPPFGLFNVQSAVADCSMKLGERILNANDLGKKRA